MPWDRLESSPTFSGAREASEHKRPDTQPSPPPPNASPCRSQAKATTIILTNISSVRPNRPDTTSTRVVIATEFCRQLPPTWVNSMV